jgi:hypothetical protein
MSTIDTIALIIKGVLLGGLGGVVLPTLWMSIVFSGAEFLQQFTNGTSVLAILTSVFTIPFSIMFTGLVEGGLRDTAMFGAITGAVVALLLSILSRFTSKRNAALVIIGAGVIVALLLVLTQSNMITLSLGLQGAQIWVLALLYVLMVAWLSRSLREVGGVS